MDTNILILSSGTRNKIVQYFKKELAGQGKVLATDASPLAPALYEADEFFVVPRIDESGYLEKILEICKEFKVNGVLSLIDPELSILAEYYEDFLSIGTQPIISTRKVVETCFDKFKFNEFIKNAGFNYIKSYLDLETFNNDFELGIIDFPVFAKPNKGSASLNINKVNSKEELELLFDRHQDLIIQEFIDGKEYGVDVYVDLISGELTSMFIKEKILMRAGETDKSSSIINQDIQDLVINFVEKLQPYGVIDIDIFEKDGEYYISEVNPRFGGGYPHAYELGVNIPANIVTNIKGVETKADINNYQAGRYMMKYNEIKIN